MTSKGRAVPPGPEPQWCRRRRSKWRERSCARQRRSGKLHSARCQRVRTAPPARRWGREYGRRFCAGHAGPKGAPQCRKLFPLL